MRRNRLRALLIAAALGSAVLLPPGPFASPALAASAVYSRTTRGFQGHDLRTRGYLDDLCVQTRFAPCLTATSRQYRPDGTAQAQVIQELAKIKDHAFYPLTSAASDPVQWEVSGADDPDPPADATDPGAEAACPTQWRIDVLTDDTAATGVLNAYEVSSWGSGDAARAELSCSIQQAQAATGLTVQPGADLVAGGSRWSQSSIDNAGQVWCTWADSPGLVFFARQNDQTLPADVRAAPGCSQAAEDALLARCRIEIDPNCAVTAPNLLAALALVFVGVRGDDAPVEPVPPVSGANRLLARPAAQLVNAQGVAELTTRVLEQPAPLTLVVDYGDGASDVIAIPADPNGATIATETTSHGYGTGFGIALVRAALYGPNATLDAESDALVAASTDFVLPGYLGFSDQALCFTGGTVSSTGEASAAVDTNGDVWQWGTVGTQLTASSPQLVPGLHGIVSVALTTPGTGVALRSDGSVWTWGGDTPVGSGTGAISDGAAGPRLESVGTGDLRTTGITALAANWENGYALTGSGALWDWGDNSAGQLGDGTVGDGSLTLDPEAPAAHGGLPALAAVTPGWGMNPTVFAAARSGDLYAWGANANGLITMDGSQTQNAVPQPARILAGVSGPFRPGMVANPDGSVTTWGLDGGSFLYGDTSAAFWGVLGHGQATYGPPDAKGPGPVQGLPGAPGVSELASGYLSEFALLGDGSVYAWGPNHDGVLGIGDGQSPMPSAARVDIGGVTELAAGGDHTLALLSDGSLRAWGYDDSGQLGGGLKILPPAVVTAPVAVAGFGTSTRVAQPNTCTGTTAAPAQRLRWSGAMKAFRPAARPVRQQLRSASWAPLSRAATAARSRHSAAIALRSGR